MTITADDLCVPTTAEKPFSGDGWIFELKYDGFRTLVTHHSGDVHLLSRKGTEYREVFPELVVAVKKLPDLVLDGELVMLDVSGKPAFDRLVRRSRLRKPITIDHAAKTEPAAIAALDLLDSRAATYARCICLSARCSRGLCSIRRARSVFSRQPTSRSMASRYSPLRIRLGSRASWRSGRARLYRRGRPNDWIKVKTKHGRAIDEERAKWNER